MNEWQRVPLWGSSIGGSCLTSFQSNQIFVEWPFFEAFSRFSNGMTFPFVDEENQRVFTLSVWVNRMKLKYHRVKKYKSYFTSLPYDYEIA